MSAPTTRRANPPAVGAARMLRWVHEAYLAQRAEAEHDPTRLLHILERSYRHCIWLSREDRARHRAVRDELRRRGVDVPPLVLAPPGPTGMRRVVR